MKKRIIYFLTSLSAAVTFTVAAVPQPSKADEVETQQHTRCTPYPECVLTEPSPIAPIIEQLLKDLETED